MVTIASKDVQPFVETLRLNGEKEAFTISAQVEFSVLSTEYWVDTIQTMEVQEEVDEDPWKGANCEEQKFIESFLTAPPR